MRDIVDSNTASESVPLLLDEVGGGGSSESVSLSDSEELSVLEGAENNDPRWEAVRLRLQRVER